MSIHDIGKRIYSDYLMGSRIFEYEELLSIMLTNNYKIYSVIDYFKSLKNRQIKAMDKILVNRHDIDTDPKTARKFFEVEKKLGVKASYYFRKSTLDVDLMKEISAYGSEASYHFEEVAAYVKRNNLHRKMDVLNRIDDIRYEFKKNILSIEEKTGIKIKSVASHGDFAKRVLDITNHPITDSEMLRKKLGIEVEAYDEKLISTFDAYLSDRAPPIKFVPLSPIEAIDKGHNKICMLTHPRQWHASWICNSRENVVRMIEGIKWMR